MKIKFPQDIEQEIEQNRIKIAERLKERLEKMSPKEIKEFKEYLEKISGNKLKHLEEAKKSFQNERCGRAFELAIASYREVINSQKLGENIERIKNSPEEWREKFQKISPGIQLPKNIQNCKISIRPECKEGEVWRIERNENGYLIFVCEKITERGREERPKICPMV